MDRDDSKDISLEQNLDKSRELEKDPEFRVNMTFAYLNETSSRMKEELTDKDREHLRGLAQEEFQQVESTMDDSVKFIKLGGDVKNEQILIDDAAELVDAIENVYNDQGIEVVGMLHYNDSSVFVAQNSEGHTFPMSTDRSSPEYYMSVQ